MSHHWSAYCVTCRSTHEYSPNRGLTQIRALIRHARELAAVQPATRDGECDVSLMAYGTSYLDVNWFAEHAEHELRPIDEYGAFDGECGRPTTCAICQHRHKCVLPYGHSGACSPVQPT